MYTKEVINAMFSVENKATRSQYFSSKEDSNEYFGKAKGTNLRIVGVEHVAANTSSDGSTINAHNRVIFDDGHMMSTSALFNAKGLLWPVGGNREKLRYLLSAFETQTTLTVVPQSVAVRFIQNKEGKFYVGKDANGNNEWADGTGEDNSNAPAKAVSTKEYTFAKCVLPNVTLIDIEEED